MIVVIIITSNDKTVLLVPDLQPCSQGVKDEYYQCLYSTSLTLKLKCL